MVRNCILLFVFGINSVLFSQNQNLSFIDFDGNTPCFLSWNPIGNFQGSDGHDITNMSYDPNVSDGVMLMDVKTNPTNHGPLFYKLSTETQSSCNAGQGLIDLDAGLPLMVIKAKASHPMQVVAYVQEGNTPSYDYSKISASALEMNLTTEFNYFCIQTIDTFPLTGSTKVDLSQIGAVAFFLGKTDGVNYDQVDGEITIDYIHLGKSYDTHLCNSTSVEEVTLSPVKIYPNPNSGSVSVELNSLAKTQIQVSDISGAVVSEFVTTGKPRFEFNHTLKSGVYFLQTINSNGKSVSKFVVK